MAGPLPTAAALLVFNTSKNFHMATRTIYVTIQRIPLTPGKRLHLHPLQLAYMEFSFYRSS